MACCRLVCIASLVTDFIQNHEELDYNGDIGNIRLKTYHLIMEQLRVFERIEDIAKSKIENQKRC